MPVVFVPMCCDFIHCGHLNVLETAASLGDVVVLLMTDAAMRKYKRDPAMKYEDRKRLVAALKQVTEVRPCDGPEMYAPLVRTHRPDYFLHGDDWKTGPQKGPRNAVMQVAVQIGCKIIEPKYTMGVSSTVLQSTFAGSIDSSKKLAVLARAGLNETKRDVAAVQRETGVDAQIMQRLMDGTEQDEASIDSLVRLLHRTYPIPKRNLLVDDDTSDSGSWWMLASQTEASARIFDRKNANGATVPYYRYMDTSMTSLSPFKPELIEELVCVEDNEPMNPLVVMNKGHLLGQLTYFIGPVNFYYTVRGKRLCKPMNTGDSCLITPYVPHSFTSRHPKEYAAILAVTFSGHVREALGELIHLDSCQLLAHAADMRRPESVLAARVKRAAELRGLLPADLRQGLVSRGIAPEDVDRAVSGMAVAVEPGTVKALSEILDVEPSEFNVRPLLEKDEVTFKPPSPAHVTGRFSLASSMHMPDIGGFRWCFEGAQPMERSSYFQYIYNIGSVAVVVTWGEESQEASPVRKLGPGDSVTFKPFINISYEAPIGSGQATLIVFKCAGCVNSAVMREAALFEPAGMGSATSNLGKWF